MRHLRESVYVETLLNESFKKGFLYGLCTAVAVIILWVAMLKNINSTPDL
jgi:hypothetical protein